MTTDHFDSACRSLANMPNHNSCANPDDLRAMDMQVEVNAMNDWHHM